MSRPRGEHGFTVIDVTVAAVILTIVLVIVGNYLFSAGRTVATSAARQDDNAAAQTALDLMEANIRFACDMAISGATLYVQSSCTGAQPSCTEWSESGGQLVEKTSGGNSAAVANGISGLGFTSNSSYAGLVTIQFNLRQPLYRADDPGGVSVTETVTARNMSANVGTSALCT